ncbi:MAG: serine/threonine protein phosphatase [Gammaproteobacteria bacterium]|nr:MAG: serine/threonine protein phosphatase [Gammaproteobacteria bacterium]
MTSIHVLSDLHLEFDGYQPAAIDVDIVVLAGDIHIGTQGFLWAKENFPDSEIIYVAGNHEFYHHDYQELLSQFRKEAEKYHIHFLENNEVVLHDIRFLGCTLWTDYLCSDDLSQQEAQQILNHRLADHRVIQVDNELFTTGHAFNLHKNSAAWLEEKLFNETFEGKTVVVTHHGPSKCCIHKKYGAGELAGAFYSDLPDLINEADVWIYGHTHSNLDISINKTRLISNQRGYPNEEILDFNQDLKIMI